MQKSMEVLRLLRKIPKGRVATYGSLAKAAKTSPRAVGQIMRRNAQPGKYKCYKVISSSGCVHGYAGCLKGENVDRKVMLLEKDGIVVKNGKIDLKKYLHRFS